MFFKSILVLCFIGLFLCLANPSTITDHSVPVEKWDLHHKTRSSYEEHGLKWMLILVEMLLTHTPKILIIKLPLFVGVDFTRGQYALRIYMKQFHDPVYARRRYLNCTDIQFVSNLPCPMKKGGEYQASLLYLIGPDGLVNLSFENFQKWCEWQWYMSLHSGSSTLSSLKLLQLSEICNNLRELSVLNP